MKARKDYGHGRVLVSVECGDKYYTIQFQGEKEMRMLGECLIDLARCGGKEVEIKEKDAVTQQRA
jgi:hypothetical protein